MAWSSPVTYTVGQVLTAANLNTYLRDNMLDLDRRTSPSQATVATSQASASTTYTDLATVGPAVTVTIGSTGKAELSLYNAQNNNTAGAPVFMAFAVSGASTVAAADTQSLAFTSPVGGGGNRSGASFLLTGLAAGSTTFTAKYRAGSNTGTWQDRQVVVTPLGS